MSLPLHNQPRPRAKDNMAASEQTPLLPITSPASQPDSRSAFSLASLAELAGTASAHAAELIIFQLQCLQELGRKLWRARWTCSLVLLVFGFFFYLFYDPREPFRSTDLPALQDPTASIRLIRVEPGSGATPIVAHIETASFSSNPSYIAISYHWGDARRVKDITLNRKRALVTENLWEALHNMRHPYEQRVFWVDSVSINQIDLHEKNTQVALMGFIYRRARRVFVSVGSHTPPRWIQASDPVTWNTSWALENAQSYGASTLYWLNTITLEEYWRRCWIVQEVGLAQDIDVFYAEHKSIPWDHLMLLYRLFNDKSPGPLTTGILRLDDMRHSRFEDQEQFHLDNLLWNFRDSFCSNKLDKLFSFAGMASDCREDCFDIDYNHTVREVYRDFMLFYSNNNSIEHSGRKIHALSLAALVRQLLVRKEVRVPNKRPFPGLLADPDTWSYDLCGDDRMVLCAEGGGGEGLLFTSLILDPLRNLVNRMKDLFRGNKYATKSAWVQSSPEEEDTWLLDATSAPAAEKIALTCACTTVVQQLGPFYFYRDKIERTEALVLNERLSILLGASADHRMRRILPLDGSEQASPRLFIGSNITLGLVSSNAKPGDTICQFWNSTAAAVITRGSSQSPSVLGRATLIKHADSTDWDRPQDRNLFRSDSPLSVDIEIGLDTLTKLSLDTLYLPGTI
ncbi:hypothetical protein, variant [Verruconis gallopava]|uniref:Heterokaryon incompatibility domain-containing protein n=1 Tax=Verruconis gallopava TaxID=253628 RepID=A0A0D2B0Y4_9PEZI|nr:hypothetical protein, variant [Verruconis gallopava]KIW04984.1 hypothetical protein, variant [Verruconis gallopava]